MHANKRELFVGVHTLVCHLAKNKLKLELLLRARMKTLTHLFIVY